ncbi:GNAT family N-acetyltransferase [Collinsella sp. AGMB00827]|uniref:tRNA carboxymethyluridine synthase n=1 Tax=Collinsella ureilytica TaxID=2869515 RepID=A0ABS7MMM7_9ACTN|nr:GNAT family N-acetyltransferase [Collinsella urealyticum]MBY4798293.1 GNAT family N-acetyltransferase [Collinsella urealyticum]
MDSIILEIARALRQGLEVDDRELTRMIHARLRKDGADKRRFAKRRLLPYYLGVKRNNPDLWKSWQIDPQTDQGIISVLRMKPRRTASGVATVTVITKPWPCSGSCLFCPNDIRMPKSYVHNEPACARAELCYFDPYLQVEARLRTLEQMGHPTDKVELIVLGGTWTDYPESYRLWFASELFRAVNERARGTGERSGAQSCGHTRSGEAAHEVCATSHGSAEDARVVDAFAGDGFQAREAARAGSDTSQSITQNSQAHKGSTQLPSDADARRAWYAQAGFQQQALDTDPELFELQALVDEGMIDYNHAVRKLYGSRALDRALEHYQTGSWEELERLQKENEQAPRRVVGLVVETRPDAISARSLADMRRLGCTKVQMGVQSLDQAVLDASGRGIEIARIQQAFSLLRLFGFKIHVHQMLNLPGSNPDRDRRAYEQLVSNPSFLPDEIKLYPCVLIGSARLRTAFEDGSWQPYPEDELIRLLADMILDTPPYCRISRMIRDFSSEDIEAGSKKPNLRQLVEEQLRTSHVADEVQEIRFREVGTAEVEAQDLTLCDVAYETTVAHEHFLEWRAPDGKIAGFLRLSLPREEALKTLGVERYLRAGEAMIREVHIYGRVARLGEDGQAAQHLGLGRALIREAQDLAARAGFHAIKVISAVGTRGYYRSLGFEDAGLYQRCEIEVRPHG